MLKFWPPSLLFLTKHCDYSYSFPLVLHEVCQTKHCNLNGWFIMHNDRTFFVQFYFLLKLVIPKLHIVFQGPWSFGHQCPWSTPTLIQRKAAKFLVAIFFSLRVRRQCWHAGAVMPLSKMETLGCMPFSSSWYATFYLGMITLVQSAILAILSVHSILDSREFFCACRAVSFCGRSLL